jgi:hypothetical protein
MQHQKYPLRIGAHPRLGYAVLGLGVAAIALATLIPSGDQSTESVFACIFCGEKALADVLVNVILYVPLGIGLALIGLRPRRAVLAGALASAVVEVIQIALPGRDASIGDVLANTCGTALGVLVVMTVALWLQPPKRLSGLLVLGWSLVVVATWGLTGWLLQPSFPKTAYHGQWTPNLGYLMWYRGRVLSAYVGGNEIRSRRAPNSEALRRDLLEGAPIDVEFVVARTTPRVSSIFSIRDEGERQVLLLGPDRDDLVLRYRTRAADFRLDQPDLRLPGAVQSLQDGDTVAVKVNRTGRGWAIALEHADTRELGFTMGSGWAVLFYAESFPKRLRDALGLLWIGGLLLPVGYWLRRDALSVTAVTLCLVGAAVIPGFTRLLATPAPLWIAMILGLVVGAATSQGVRRLRHAARDATVSGS